MDDEKILLQLRRFLGYSMKCFIIMDCAPIKKINQLVSQYYCSIDLFKGFVDMDEPTLC